MTEIQDAKLRARRLYQSRAFQRAYVAGAAAAIRGQGQDVNPYPPDPAKTWRRTYQLAWNRGWISIEGGGFE